MKCSRLGYTREAASGREHGREQPAHDAERRVAVPFKRLNPGC